MPHTARPGAAAWHCHVQCDARQLDVDFKLSRPIPVRGSTVLADAWHNIGGQAAPPLGCNLGDSSDDAISIGSFTVTASSAALAGNITYNFSVLNPDADPLAMDWAGNCGNLGRDGFFLQPGQPSSAALGPLPMQVIFHHATSTPETIKGVYLMFGAERNDTHAALTVTSASPNAIARGTLTRLLLQPPIRATSS